MDQAKAKVAQDEAQLAFDEAEYQRNSKLITKGGVSRSDLEKSDAARHVDLANIAADKAVVASRKLDLQYTKVTAPIAGRVSRYVVTVGNLVQSGDQANMTLLTTIVSVDPIYAYFDVDERTVQRARQWLRNGQAEPSADKGPSPDKRSSPVLGLAVDAGLPVALRVATEDGFPHRGTINFVDNQVNPKTGTLRVRGVFPNKDEMLTTGFFASVRLPISAPHRALLVTDRAIDSDQGQKILYVVNDKNEVLSRPVRVGSLHDGLRAIEDGLKPGERVVVNGLQTVRSGITVEPKLEDMPMSGPESEDRNPREIRVSKSP